MRSTKQRAKVQAKRATLIKSHIERFNNIIRQRLGRLVRKTLSFPSVTRYTRCVCGYFCMNTT